MSACPSCRGEPPAGARFCPACGTRLEAFGPEATERKVVTTLFADLVGFTALGERHDPEDIDAALRAFYGLARTIIERFGGTVEKFIGDAVVGLFGVPSAHEDDAERAVRAALELVAHLHDLPPVGGERLQVRCAVNTGPALVRLHARPEAGEGVLVGDAVNTCSRLLAEAPAMEVVAGDMTRRLSSRAIEYEELPAFAARGKEEPVKRWLARGAASRRGTDSGLCDEPETVGREVELALLSGLIDEAIASGKPQYALVTGEAGIGKSRLMRDLFRLVDARSDLLCNWRQSSCPPYGTSLAYWSLREIVSAHAGIMSGDPPDVVDRRLRDAVAGSSDREWLAKRLRSLMGLTAPASSRNENLAAWTRFFESIALGRQAVIVIEDLHWASDPTLEFLRYFVTHASNTPLLLVGTARPEFLEKGTDVFRQMPRTRYVRLRPLGPGESYRLAAALLEGGDDDLAREVAQGCGGNPLFAEELARFLSHRRTPDSRSFRVAPDVQAPTSILTLISARLDALPPDQRSLLADASVIGSVFWPTAVAAVRRADVKDIMVGLVQLQQREFLRRHADSTMPGQAELSFWHALVRDIAYERMPRAARAVRHLRAARWLESRAGDGDDFAEIVAHHYATGLDLAGAANERALIAENLTSARSAFARAGDRALRLDVTAAERYYGLALHAAEDAEPDLLLKRGDALRQVGRFLEAAELQKRAVRILQEAGDPRRHAYALSRLAFTIGWSQPDEGRRMADQAVAMLDEEASAEAISVLETWATLRLWQDDLSAVLDATESIVGMSGRLGRPPPPRTLGLHGYARFILGDPDGLAEMEVALAIAEDSTAPAAELFGLREAYARCICVADDPGRALALIGSWIAEAQHRRDTTSLMEFGEAAARCHLLSGQWDEALAAIADLTDVGRRHENPVIEAELCAIRITAHFCRGTPRAAMQDGGRYERLLPEIGEEESVPLGNIAVAAVAAGEGETGRAGRLLEEVVETRFSREPREVLWWPLAVRTALAAQQSALAERLADIALDWPSCPERVRLTLTALFAERAGRVEEAVRDYALAARAWRTGGSPYEEGLALLGQGQCLLDLGRRAEGLALLADARALFDGIGSRLAVAEVDHVRRRAASDAG